MKVLILTSDWLKKVTNLMLRNHCEDAYGEVNMGYCMIAARVS